MGTDFLRKKIWTMVVKRATLHVFAARFIIDSGYVHIIPDSFCTAAKIISDSASVHTRERLLSGTLWRSETAQRWSQKWSVTYPIGFVPYLDAVWTPIQPLVEVNKQRDLESTETGENILRREDEEHQALLANRAGTMIDVCKRRLVPPLVVMPGKAIGLDNPLLILIKHFHLLSDLK